MCNLYTRFYPLKSWNKVKNLKTLFQDWQNPQSIGAQGFEGSFFLGTKSWNTEHHRGECRSLPPMVFPLSFLPFFVVKSRADLWLGSALSVRLSAHHSDKGQGGCIFALQGENLHPASMPPCRRSRAVKKKFSRFFDIFRQTEVHIIDTPF